MVAPAFEETHAAGAHAGAHFAATVPDPTGSFSIPISLHYVAGEVASLAAIMGAFAQALPSIATLMAIIWYGVVLYESRTGRRLIQKFHKAGPPPEVAPAPVPPEEGGDYGG